VLSFADPVEPLGGIAVSYQTVEREAAAQKKIFTNHAKHMILHGFLHLLGHDHQVRKAARLMEGIEIAILDGLGIPNPYLIEKKPSA
jgi:probable rRNA maturation factor